MGPTQKSGFWAFAHIIPASFPVNFVDQILNIIINVYIYLFIYKLELPSTQ